MKRVSLRVFSLPDFLKILGPSHCHAKQELALKNRPPETLAFVTTSVLNYLTKPALHLSIFS